MGLAIWDLGSVFRVWGLGQGRVGWDLSFRIRDLGLGFGVNIVGFGLKGSGFRV